MPKSGSVRGRGAAARSRQFGDTSRFGLDQLESRVMLSTVSWDGGGATDSWHDKANWTNDTLPGASDDVFISVQEDPSITFTAGGATIASLVCNEQLTISGGTLTVTGDASQSGRPLLVAGGTVSVAGTYRFSNSELGYNSGTISATPELSSSALKLGGGAGAVTFILGGGSTIAGDIAANQTVWVRGGNFGANANVKAAVSFTNAGTLRLESQDLEWETFLTITSGVLTNTGTIEANLGSGGPNRIIGSLENKGAFKVQGGASLSLELGGGKEFKHSAGTSTLTGNLVVNNGAMTLTGGAVSVGGGLRVAFGSLSWTAGTLTGGITIAGSGLTLGPGAVSAADFVIHGGSTFNGNIGAAQTVWVQGSDDLGSATLNAPAAVTNAGLLRLESINNEWESTVNMQNSAVLTNAGTLEANLGSGGSRTVLGKLTNDGTVAIESGVTLFNGSYTQGAGGLLRIDVEGAAPGQFGKLQSSGTVSLAGEFEAVYLNGFLPAKFDSLQFITASTVTGKFSTLTLPFEDPNPYIKTLLVYSGSDVRLLITSTADLNNDGKLDLFDFLTFTNFFNAKDPQADFTGDGVFDLFDFLTFINVFNM